MGVLLCVYTSHPKLSMCLNTQIRGIDIDSAACIHVYVCAFSIQ